MARPSSPYHAPSHQANRFSGEYEPSLTQPARCCGFTSRLVNLVLFIYNYVFLLAGCVLVLATQLYGRPEVSVYLGDKTRHLVTIVDLLDEVISIQLVHYSMLCSGLVLVVMSSINIIVSLITSWSRSSDYYYYKRKRKFVADENLLNASTLESNVSRNSNWTTFTSSSTTSCVHSVSPASYPSRCSAISPPESRNTTTTTTTQSVLSHCANSPLANCCHIFLLLGLFTLTLVVSVVALFIISPQQQHSRSSAREDAFLGAIRDRVDVRRLLLQRAQQAEALFEPYRCCGWNSFDDYEHLTPTGVRNRSLVVPDACCKTVVKGCGRRKHPSNIYYRGCAGPWGGEMRDYVLTLAWLALGFSVVELVGLMFAICHYVQVVSKARSSS